jgi:hypothetical protein
MDVVVIVIGVALCILSFIAYMLISIYAPEWLGMSGKNADKGEDKTNNEDRPKDFFSR